VVAIAGGCEHSLRCCATERSGRGSQRLWRTRQRTNADSDVPVRARNLTGVVAPLGLCAQPGAEEQRHGACVGVQ
jgi:hypothetical protein